MTQLSQEIINKIVEIQNEFPSLTINKILQEALDAGKLKNNNNFVDYSEKHLLKQLAQYERRLLEARERE